MKTIEQKKPLLQRTLFGVKRATLEAKITSYFEFSQMLLHSLNTL